MNRRVIYRLGISVLLIAIISWAISCAVNPVTKKREFVLLSEQDEILLGKQTDAQVVQTYGLYNDSQLDGYINSMGQKMAKMSHRPNLDFSFKVLDSPVINAFAVPGGYIYFTRGILAYLNNEAELAGVMGHEIGHVTARHSVQQYTRAMGTQLLLGLGSAMSETFNKYAGIAEFGVSMMFLRFSRDNERQADELGVEYSSKVGYDALNMANFFVTLERMHPSEGGVLPDWFSTHPNPTDRVKSIQKDAQKFQAKRPGRNFAVNRDQFLKKIDGIIYGDDPRQGYVEENVFYHPQMRFQFAVPAGWQVNNTPNQVQIFNSAQDAVIIFTLAKGNSATAAASQFVQESGLTIINSEKTIVNGLTAHRVNSQTAETEQTKLRVQSYFIQFENNVFVFHGYTTSDKFSSYSVSFSNTMTQFKRLTDQRKINVQPNKLRVKKVTSSGNLRRVLQRYKVPSDKLEEMAVINGMQLTDPVSAGTLIKVVE